MALTMFKNFQPPHLQICGSGKLLGALELKQYCCFLQEFAGPGLSALLSLGGSLTSPGVVGWEPRLVEGASLLCLGKQVDLC